MISFYLEAQEPTDRTMVSDLPVFLDFRFEFLYINSPFSCNSHIVRHYSNNEMLLFTFTIEDRMVDHRMFEAHFVNEDF